MPLFEVRRGQGSGFGGGGTPGARMTTMGELVAVDTVTAWLLDGRMYQVRAGTIATGLDAQNVIADAKADMCADAASGTTIIPVDFRIAARSVATATTLQVAVKAIQGTASTTATAFVPLPLKGGGPAAVSTARVQADSVVVPAELATNTVRLFEYEDVQTQTPTTVGGNTSLVAVAASTADLMRYVGVGVSLVYVQVASTTAQTAYFATLNYAEFPSLMINPS